METYKHPKSFAPNLGSYRTYEEWKLTLTMKDDSVLSKSSYRTYEEWKRYYRGEYWKFALVLTVPMRNGNDETLFQRLQELLGSYRTYEEWKLQISPSNLQDLKKVLTVPMRNGNA